MATGKKREKILGGARKVFEEKGYSDATVSDILAEAGVARATFYRYFQNKRQVFFELISDFLDSLYENTNRYLAEMPADPSELHVRLRASMVTFARIMLEHRGLIRAYYAEAFGQDVRLYAVWNNLDSRMAAMFKEYLDRGMRSGIIRPVETGLLARAMVMMFLQVPYQEFMVRSRSEIDIEAIGGEIADFIMRGLLVPAAVAALDDRPGGRL